MSWTGELIKLCRSERERSAVRLAYFQSGKLRLCQSGQDITHTALEDCQTSIAMDKLIALTMIASFSTLGPTERGPKGSGE